MKKMLLTLLMLVAATATIAAQDEQTAPPIINVEMAEDGMALVTIVNSDDDPYADIYFDYSFEEGEFSEWMPYTGDPFVFTEVGTYHIRAFAQSPGKTMSAITELMFVISPVYTHPYSFIVDGIYYLIRSDDEVWVSTETLEEQPHSALPYSTHNAYSCYSDEVVIPESVEYEGETYTVTGIAMCAFEYCRVTRVILPNTITYIDDHAFSNSRLREITLPASLTEIGHFAFYGCSYLSKIVCMGTVPPEFSQGYSNQAIAYINRDAALFVPLESLEAYKTHAIWSQFKLRIVPFIGAGPGDIDGSGSIDVDDVVDIIGMILDGTVPEYADVNGDGSIDIDDITVLINMLLNGH